jgi:putative ABC transport system permease protein
VGALFFLTGLINFLNLSLAELTANLKKIGIVKTLGGIADSHRKIALAESLLALGVVIPLTTILAHAGLWLAKTGAAIVIDEQVWHSVPFLSIASAMLLAFLLSLRINAHVLSRVTNVVLLFRGQLAEGHAATDARKHLVMIQLCFSVVMIGVMGVIADQFYFIEHMDKGFESKNTLVLRLRSGPASSVRAFEAALNDLSGVKAVARSTYYPGAVETKHVFEVESASGIQEQPVHMMCCSRNYLQTLGIGIKKGRHLADSASEADAYLINEAAAQAFGWKDPIGKRIRGPVSGGDEAFQEGVVVGMTADFHFNSLHNKVEPLIMLADQDDWMGNYLYVKLNPLQGGHLVGAIEQAHHHLWPENAFEWEYLDQKYEQFYARDEQMKTIFEFGLGISLLVCCLGIFSISALLLRLRTREACIRKVVGASSGQLYVLHTETFLRLTVVAVAIACPLIAYLSDRWLTNFAYHVGFKPVHYIVPATTAFLITLLASGYHGVRSSRINLVNVLKEE